ncbi:MAG: arsenite methyltransferase [Anaerolineales bacterium]
MMTKASQTYFATVANHWDVMRSRYFTEEVRTTALQKAYLRTEMVVADIGAGTGFISAGVAPLVRQVHVIDSSPAMLNIARKNLAQFGHVVYHEADGLSLPLPDESMDAVFANMYLHHCPDPLAAIREMTRILRPGGRLIITDIDKHDYEWMLNEMADEWPGFERRQIKEWLKEASLVNRIVDSTGQTCCAKSSKTLVTDGQGHTASISIFVAVGTRRMDGMQEIVQKLYGDIAVKGSACCSQPAEAETSPCCTTITDCCHHSASIETAEQNGTGYEHQALNEAPVEAAEISLGCGNPVALANLQPGEIVLDIGSGGGIDVFLAAQKVGATGRVIGVDMTTAMLKKARQIAKKHGYANVEFRKGTAEKLPVADHSVDVVLSNCVINLSEDKGLAFEEAYRVLRPGGRLEISDIVASTSLPLDIQNDPYGWAECISGALPEQEYLDLIKQAGFTEITVQNSREFIQLGDVRIYSLLVQAEKR